MLSVESIRTARSPPSSEYLLVLARRKHKRSRLGSDKYNSVKSPGVAKRTGFAYTRFPFSKMEEFRAAERDARERGKGLWGEPEGGSGLEPSGGVALADQQNDVRLRVSEPYRVGLTAFWWGNFRL